MGVPPMSIPRLQVDQEVLDHIRERIAKRKAGGYISLAIQIGWLEQLIAATERELKNENR